MKISRRSVLHISGLAAAALALTGCSAAGSAALGGKLPGLLKGLAKKGETAASSEAASDMAVTPPPEGEQLDPAFGVLPEYDADILTGAERSTNSRPVAVMVNNIANSQRQNARPQRGIGSADLLIEPRSRAASPPVRRVQRRRQHPRGRPHPLRPRPVPAAAHALGHSLLPRRREHLLHPVRQRVRLLRLNIGGKNYFKTPIHPIVSHRNNRGRDVAYEHTEFTSGKEICKAASDAGISLYAPSEGTFFHFADYRTDEVNKLKGEPSAKKITIVHSESYRTSFSYSALSHSYAMQMYTPSKKAAENTVDELTGEQLTFENVVVCFADMDAYAGDSHDVQEVQYIKGGDAYLFTRGGVQVGRWEKTYPTNPLKLYTKSGEEMTLNRGKTYFALVDNDELNNFSCQ